jgi:uncharacterized protein YcbX
VPAPWRWLASRGRQGGTALIDRRRFRPNFYVDTGDGPERFVEDEWLGRALAIGDSVVLDEFEPTLWCVTSTLRGTPDDQHKRSCSVAVEVEHERRGDQRRGEQVSSVPCTRGEIGPRCMNPGEVVM